MLSASRDRQGAVAQWRAERGKSMTGKDGITRRKALGAGAEGSGIAK